MTNKFKVGDEVFWLAKSIEEEYQGSFPFCKRKVSRAFQNIFKNNLYCLVGSGDNIFYENELFTKEEVKKNLSEWICL